MESRSPVKKSLIDRFVLFENSSEFVSDAGDEPAMSSHPSRRSGEIEKRRALGFRWKPFSSGCKPVATLKMSRRIGVYQYPLIWNIKKGHGIVVFFEEPT